MNLNTLLNIEGNRVSDYLSILIKVEHEPS